MEETNKDPNFMAQADVDKKLEEKFKAANQKLEEIQKVIFVFPFDLPQAVYQYADISANAVRAI